MACCSCRDSYGMIDSCGIYTVQSVSERQSPAVYENGIRVTHTLQGNLPFESHQAPRGDIGSSRSGTWEVVSARRGVGRWMSMASVRDLGPILGSADLVFLVAVG